ncbi:unnamed protein product [Pleuronectes platessa]|uniref:Uncharacterized protein n=1 Tax=Pleuronectes platessa TaxID=8262 RepID=A0A9N7Y6C1_PLEPL|nr:unnamed protein product [Pleuronectes platessa]
MHYPTSYPTFYLTRSDQCASSLLNNDGSGVVLIGEIPVPPSALSGPLREITSHTDRRLLTVPPLRRYSADLAAGEMAMGFWQRFPALSSGSLVVGLLAQPVYLQVFGRQLALDAQCLHGPRGCWDLGTLAPNTNG